MTVKRDWINDALSRIPDYGRLSLTEIKDMNYTFADMTAAEQALLELWLVVWEHEA